MGKLFDFLSEMRRRRVFRTLGLYILGAWATLQVADLAFEAWGLPAEAMRYVWIAGLIGLPAAAVFGWQYDFVDGRIIHASSSSASNTIRLQRTDYLLLSAIGVLALLTLLGTGAEIRDTIKPRAEATTVSPPPGGLGIAVLTFGTAGDGRNTNEVIALGLQEGLLTELSRIQDLRVISRTSTERYRGTGMSIAAIAAELGVNLIIEGTVQNDGDDVRINIQLIDSAGDSHLWADTFDNDLEERDLFSIQSDIVERVVDQVVDAVGLDQRAPLAAPPTDSLDAYTKYLEGQQAAIVGSVESQSEAIQHYRRAIEIDPNFGEAYAALAKSYLTRSIILGQNESSALVEPLLSRAFELKSDMPEAFATLGLLRQRQGNTAAAEHAYLRAIELRPSFADAYRLFGSLRWGENRREEALAFARAALAIDPFSIAANYNIARYLDSLGQFDEAMQRYQRVVQEEPDHAYANLHIAAMYYLVYGRADESLVWYHDAASKDLLSPGAQAVPAIAYLELGKIAEANLWISRGDALDAKSFWTLFTRLLAQARSDDRDGVQQAARALLEAYPRSYDALRFLRNADLQAGRLDAAILRYRRAHPELFANNEAVVNHANVNAAVDLALVLKRSGDTEHADRLLDGAIAACASMPRFGVDGYWITDVRAYATQGRKDLALETLARAAADGWRILSWHYFAEDPNLGPLRDDRRFQQIRAEVEADLVTQRQRVDELKASGELALP